jgi:hypothetical protein
MIRETSLVPTATVEALCRAYEDSKRDVREAFRLLHQTEQRLKPVIENPHFLPDNWYLYEKSGPEAIKKMLQDGWEYLYRKTRVWEVCSSKQRDELERELHRGELPELTELNVLAFLEKLQASLPDMFEQSLKEVFDWLRPCGQWGPHYKTNSKFSVGKKVILGYCVDRPWGGRYDVRYEMRQRLHALDNVFHLLDGQGIARYPNDLVTAINTAGDKGGTMCETAYFSCKWFNNGNLHVTFSRLDLVKELNKRAGASGLADYQPQDAGIVPVSGPGAGGNGDGDPDEPGEDQALSGADAGVDAGTAAGSGGAVPAADAALPDDAAPCPGAAPGVGGAVRSVP